MVHIIRLQDGIGAVVHNEILKEIIPIAEKGNYIIEFCEIEADGITCGSILTTVSYIHNYCEKVKLYEFKIIFLFPSKYQGSCPIPILSTQLQNLNNKDYSKFWIALNKATVVSYNIRDRYVTC